MQPCAAGSTSSGFYPHEAPIQGLLDRWLESHDPEARWVARLVDSANELLGDRHLGIGPSHFMKRDMPLNKGNVRFIWEQAVIPYIEEQYFGDEEKLAQFGFDRLLGNIRVDESEPSARENDLGEVG